MEINKIFIGTLQNKIKVTSHVANLAGHISNDISFEILRYQDGETTFVRLEKEEAINLRDELNNQLKKLL